MTLYLLILLLFYPYVYTCYQRDPITEPTIYELESIKDYELVIKSFIKSVKKDITDNHLEFAYSYITSAISVDGFHEHSIVDRVKFFWYLQGIWNGYVGVEYSSRQYMWGFLNFQKLLPIPSNLSDRVVFPCRYLWTEYPCETNITEKTFRVTSTFLESHFGYAYVESYYYS